MRRIDSLYQFLSSEVLKLLNPFSSKGRRRVRPKKGFCGTMADLARKTSLNRENLYRSPSKKGSLWLSSLASILDAVGIKLYFALTKKQKRGA